MHKLKELYSSPSSELLVVRFEESLLNSYSDQGTELLPIDPEGDF